MCGELACVVFNNLCVIESISHTDSNLVPQVSCIFLYAYMDERLLYKYTYVSRFLLCYMYYVLFVKVSHSYTSPCWFQRHIVRVPFTSAPFGQRPSLYFTATTDWQSAQQYPHTESAQHLMNNRHAINFPKRIQLLCICKYKRASLVQSGGLWHSCEHQVSACSDFVVKYHRQLESYSSWLKGSYCTMLTGDQKQQHHRRLEHFRQPIQQSWW